MKKPEIQTTRHVDLLHACNYLEKNGFPGANNSIFDGEYNNDSMTSLPCFDGRDEFCEDPDDYETLETPESSRGRRRRERALSSIE